MLELDIILILLVLGAAANALLRAPEGYEDEAGFHYHRRAR